MVCVADTNVVARRVLTADPLHDILQAAVDGLILRGEAVHACAQNMIEFHTLVARPPQAEGLGLSSSEARAEARSIESVFPLLPDTPAVYPFRCDLVDRCGVVGPHVYDDRQLAVMLAHRVTHRLTLNPSHFRRYSEIAVIAL